MTAATWKTAHVDEIPRMGHFWIPVRHHFDVRAFGVNAWRAQEEGDEIVSRHKEDTGHEELYFVTSGHATFTVGGEEVDAPVGTFVFVGDPDTTRKGVAKQAGTTVVSIGAKPGEAYDGVSDEAALLYETRDYEGAAALLREALERDRAPATVYGLACMEALLGRNDDAIEHLREIAHEPRFRELAASDSDFDSLRDDPRFAELVAA